MEPNSPEINSYLEAKGVLQKFNAALNLEVKPGLSVYGFMFLVYACAWSFLYFVCGLDVRMTYFWR